MTKLCEIHYNKQIIELLHVHMDIESGINKNTLSVYIYHG